MNTVQTLPISIPTGFDWVYLVFFALGMVAHFIVRLADQAGGWTNIKSGLTGFFGKFVAWFFNKFHLTLIGGAAAAVMALGETYGLNVSFATINTLGVVLSLVAGYIGDSAFNNVGSNPLKTD